MKLLVLVTGSKSWVPCPPGPRAAIDHRKSSGTAAPDTRRPLFFLFTRRRIRARSGLAPGPEGAYDGPRGYAASFTSGTGRGPPNRDSVALLPVSDGPARSLRRLSRRYAPILGRYGRGHRIVPCLEGLPVSISRSHSANLFGCEYPVSLRLGFHVVPFRERGLVRFVLQTLGSLGAKAPLSSHSVHMHVQ